MGFFGKLFEKKSCDLCGGDIGLLGNRKLEDGNCCKACAAKLSPWFSERRKSTVADIRQQLEYREENKEKVAAFHTTRTLGRTTKVMLDEDAGKFMVTSAKNLAEANPDVIDFSQVTGCDLDVQEHKTEETREVRDKDGHTRRVSYNPPRYRYSYDFYIIIRVNTPYFDEIKFKLNSGSVSVHSMYGQPGYGAPGFGAARPGAFGRPAQNGDMLGSVLQGITNAVGAAAAGAQMAADPRMQCPEYAEFYNMGMEIKAALTSIHTQVRENIAAENAPKTAVTCPYCGATTVPDASGCCEFCGGAVGS